MEEHLFSTCFTFLAQVILSTIVGTIALYLCGSLHLYRQLGKKNEAHRSTEWRNGYGELQVLKQVNTLISFDFFLLPRRRASTGLLRMDDDDDEEGEEEEEEDGRKKNGGGVSPAVIGVGIGVVVYAVMFA